MYASHGKVYKKQHTGNSKKYCMYMYHEWYTMFFITVFLYESFNVSQHFIAKVFFTLKKRISYNTSCICAV